MMSKYKVGDKVVMEIMRVDDGVDLMNVGSCGCSWCIPASQIDRMSKPLSTYTEPLEAKIRRQAAEITRLLAENKELKERVEKANKISFNGGRLAGQNEAWKLARKIARQPISGGYKRSEFEEILGCGYISDIFENYTYQEAAAKVEAWEKAKEEIKVGDVFQDDDGNNAIVTSIKGNTIYYMWDDGDTRSGFAEDVKKHFTKTGRHIDIDSFLKQIGEE